MSDAGALQKLSQHWTEIPFDLLFDNVTSSSLKLPTSQYLASGKFPVIDQGERLVGGFTDDDGLLHPHPGPVIVFGDHTRCVKFVNTRFVQGADGVKVLSTSRHVDPKYSYWTLRHTEVPSKGYARHYALLRKLKFPLPPLPEQRRIVEVIESYLTRLDDAVATLERVQRNLKRYRASVLKAAVEGRLVPTEAELARAEGRGYEPASVLLERILTERRRRWQENKLAKMKAKGKTLTDDEAMENPAPPDPDDLSGLPEGWCWTRIDVAGRVQLGRQRSPAHHTGLHMRPYLRVANVFEDRIDTRDVMSMNFTPTEFDTYRLEFGDILLNEGQSPHLVGRPAMYRNEVPNACFTNSLVRFQASAGVDRRYALIVFLAQLHTRRYMQIAKITTNIAHLGAGRFAAIEFPLPPLKEQSRIADEVERLLTIASATFETARANNGRGGRLRQSMLMWAFEGRLVDRDPTDEPASALLERIRAERSASPPTKKSKVARRSTNE